MFGNTLSSDAQKTLVSLGKSGLATVIPLILFFSPAENDQGSQLERSDEIYLLGNHPPGQKIPLEIYRWKRQVK